MHIYIPVWLCWLIGLMVTIPVLGFIAYWTVIGVIMTIVEIQDSRNWKGWV